MRNRRIWERTLHIRPWLKQSIVLGSPILHVTQQNTILTFTTMLKIIILWGMVAFILTLRIFSSVKALQNLILKIVNLRSSRILKAILSFKTTKSQILLRRLRSCNSSWYNSKKWVKTEERKKDRKSGKQVRN